MDEWWWLEDHNGAQVQTEDTRETVYKFLEQELKITNARETIEFQRLHGLGKPKSGSSRPIRLLHVFALWR